MAVDTRPTTLTAAHNYNLRNQGWPTRCSLPNKIDGDDGLFEGDPVSYTKTINGYYPSNADIMYYSKMAAATDPQALNVYSPWELRKQIFGNTPAAKGHFILPYFDKNRQLAANISSIYDPTRDQIDERPISVAFMTGRVWYLMPFGELLYSQVLTEVSRCDKCYQEADPTAEDINELVATDGGTLDITGIGKAQKLVVVGNTMVILADNGVWGVSGSGDESFSAVSQEIRKITSVGCIGLESAIEVENSLFFWSQGGIYVLVQDQVTGYLTAQNITDTTILSYYLDITPIARANARAFYDEESKKIFWFYNSDPEFDGVNWRYKFDKALIFDIVLKTFYPYSMDASAGLPFISAAAQKKANSFESVVENIYDADVLVTDSAVTVTQTITTAVTAEVKIKLLTFLEQANSNYKYTFSEYKNDVPYDWQEETGGENYESYIEMGYDLSGDLISEKETNTIYAFFKRTETETVLDENNELTFDYPSSCYMRAKWDWTDSADSGRWSESQQIYRLNRHWIPTGIGPFEYGTDVVQTINQVRGKGHAVSLRFESEEGKDFHLLGWAIPYSIMVGA
jgi:hypothetical protein